ncbi:MAG: AbrB/MazE/SpoVT family DNA-binding domain-containing protein [Clostridiales bacterium]|nr:AbrB/MazE/SpoVT family DNA-binding domain-containing protein [Clostridiales bacterium]
MVTSIQKWGNSQGIRIPKAMLDSLKWSPNTEITLTAEEDKIIIRKSNSRKTIKELFEGYEGNYEPTQIDWGKPVGNEIW